MRLPHLEVVAAPAIAAAPKPSTPTPAINGRVDFAVAFIHSLLDDYGLSPQEFRVYAHLSRRAGNGAAWPAVATIAAICLLDTKTVRKALKSLVQKRLINREERPGRTPFYTLTQASQWAPRVNITRDATETATPAPKRVPTPIKSHEGHPSQTAPSEGNPLESNPLKKETYTHTRRGLPETEYDAVEQGKLHGIPEAFARTEYNRMVGVGWLDGASRPVKSWPHYLKQRWTKEQFDRAERTQGRTTARTTRRVPPPRQFNTGNYSQPIENL